MFCFEVSKWSTNKTTVIIEVVIDDCNEWFKRVVGQIVSHLRVAEISRFMAKKNIIWLCVRIQRHSLHIYDFQLCSETTFIEITYV